METIRFLNTDEVYYLCKVILQDKRDISVGKTIMQYARLKVDEDLFRAVHARLLETGKYVETPVMDKYGFNRIRYAPRPSWRERYFIPIAIVSFIMGGVVDIGKEVLIRKLLPESSQSAPSTPKKPDTQKR